MVFQDRNLCVVFLTAEPELGTGSVLQELILLNKGTELIGECVTFCINILQLRQASFEFIGNDFVSFVLKCFN